MTYYDYITQFKGIEHPYGDLAADFEWEVESSENPDILLDILEGKSFSDIYEHLVDSNASVKCMDTFVESWASYLQQEKKAISDPIPALILYQLTQLNKGLGNLVHLEEMAENLDIISTALAETSQILNDVTEIRGDRGEYALIRVCGAIDTYGRAVN